MKTMKMNAALTIFLLLPFLTMAQDRSPAEKIYEKYAGQEHFTSVNISKELFQMLMKIDVQGEGTEEIKQMQSMLDQIDGLKVLSFHDSINGEKVSTLYNEFAGLFPAGTYVELMSIKENGDNIRFLTKQGDDGKILELIMLSQEKNEVTLLSLIGHIDMSTISDISRSMKIHGMENLEKIKEEKKPEK